MASTVTRPATRCYTHVCVRCGAGWQTESPASACAACGQPSEVRDVTVTVALPRRRAIPRRRPHAA